MIALYALIACANTSASSFGTASVSIAPLPNSAAFQATFTVSYDNCDEENPYYTNCDWFGEASAYPAGTVCPSVWDGTQSVWVGDFESDPGTDTETTVIYDEVAPAIVLCIYASDYAAADDLLATVTYTEPPPVSCRHAKTRILRWTRTHDGKAWHDHFRRCRVVADQSNGLVRTWTVHQALDANGVMVHETNVLGVTRSGRVVTEG